MNVADQVKEKLGLRSKRVRFCYEGVNLEYMLEQGFLYVRRDDGKFVDSCYEVRDFKDPDHVKDLRGMGALVYYGGREAGWWP